MDDGVRETAKWLALVHAPPGQWHHHLHSCLPGQSPADLAPHEIPAFLSRLLDAARCDDEAVRRDLRWLEAASDRHFVPIVDRRYPRRLLELPDPPLGLFAQGDLHCLARPCLSIVGSRNPTPQGRETAADFARQLAAMNITVVSGLARGIDGCAHRGALETGATAAVCGNGLDTVYPRAHRELAGRIAGSGVLVSEFTVGTGPRPGHFPRRNRLISGLSLGTLVIEAGVKSGSLITARLAVEQNREVFAVPGAIHSPQSRGCHALIRNGAILVETLEDILREIQPLESHWRQSHPPQSGGSGSEHEWFLAHMGYSPCTRDELVKRSGLTSGEVSSMLLVLELEGCVELCPGGTYVRVTRS